LTSETFEMHRAKISLMDSRELTDWECTNI